ncbi:MAG TPA: N-formylglutamate deformylase [Steroidobacteraceae bacterium]
MEDVLNWLHITRNDMPLILSMPHAGIDLPAGYAHELTSAWLARRDADWWIDKLYDFGAALGATVVRTAISRTVIDVNRDPSGASLYPGQATTELCPTTTFDGEALYRSNHAPDVGAIALRRDSYYQPYHAALAAEIRRLKAQHPLVVVYDCHSIRSRIPRLFNGELPNFNLGTHSGASCAPALTAAIEHICDATTFSRVTNGRFKGGYITRHYGRPHDGVHALQMELACRGYMAEKPGPVAPEQWPPHYDERYAAPMRTALRAVLTGCLEFAMHV